MRVTTIIKRYYINSSFNKQQFSRIRIYYISNKHDCVYRFMLLGLSVVCVHALRLALNEESVSARPICMMFLTR